MTVRGEGLLRGGSKSRRKGRDFCNLDAAKTPGGKKGAVVLPEKRTERILLAGKRESQTLTSREKGRWAPNSKFPA